MATEKGVRGRRGNEREGQLRAELSFELNQKKSRSQGLTSSSLVDQTQRLQSSDLQSIDDSLPLELVEPSWNDDDRVLDGLASKTLSELSRVRELHSDEFLNGPVFLSRWTSESDCFTRGRGDDGGEEGGSIV